MDVEILHGHIRIGAARPTSSPRTRVIPEVEVVPVVKVLELEKWQYEQRPGASAGRAAAIARRNATWRKHTVRIMVVVQRQPKLFEIVATRHPACCLAGGLNCGQ